MIIELLQAWKRRRSANTSVAVEQDKDVETVTALHEVEEDVEVSFPAEVAPGSAQTKAKRKWSKASMPQTEPFPLGDKSQYAKGGSVRKKTENYNHEDIPKTTEAVTAIHEDEEPLVWPCLDTVDHGGWPQGEKGDPHQQSSNRDNSGDLHSADSPNPDATATEHGGAMLPGGFVYQGRWYRGVAASNPIFLPPENFFIPQPQLWSQCACERICMRCVYDGEEFCEGCRATTLSVSSSTLYRSCNCEPGCCGLPGSSDLSESEEITEVSF